MCSFLTERFHEGLGGVENLHASFSFEGLILLWYESIFGCVGINPNYDIITEPHALGGTVLVGGES